MSLSGSQGARFFIKSDSFNDQGLIAAKYTCLGENLSPQLSWGGEPSETKSFALICRDPDAPSGDFIHWVIYSIPPQVHQLSEGLSKDSLLADGTKQGINDFGKIGYGGPCPPPGKPHHYIFTLYALSEVPSLKASASRDDLLKAIHPYVVAEVSLVGLFERHK